MNIQDAIQETLQEFFDKGLDMNNVKNWARFIDDATSKNEVNGSVSDGYHTFDELYDHRVLLWINLVKLQHPKICYLVEDHFEGWFLLGVETIYGQLSYHCPNKYLHFCKNINRRHPQFDGHTSNDVLNRLKLLIIDDVEGRL